MTVASAKSCLYGFRDLGTVGAPCPETDGGHLGTCVNNEGTACGSYRDIILSR